MEKLMKILEEVKPGFDFTGKTGLASNGVLDSFEVITLVAELDDAFNIEIPVEAIEPENFDSIEAIWKLVSEQMKG